MKFLIEKTEDCDYKILFCGSEEDCKKELENLQVENAKNVRKYYEGSNIYDNYRSDKELLNLDGRVYEFINYIRLDGSTKLIEKIYELIKEDSNIDNFNLERFIETLNDEDKEKIQYYLNVNDRKEINPMSVIYKIVSLNEVL